MNPKHSSKSSEHFTPGFVIEASRALMGSITLDPASCALANTAVVEADRFFTRSDDGLSLEWGPYERVFLNPPGGKTRNVSNARRWWFKLAREYLAGRVRIPSSRIDFLHENADGGLCPGEDPPHASVIVYLPSGGFLPGHDRDWLEQHFGHIGACISGRPAR